MVAAAYGSGGVGGAGVNIKYKMVDSGAEKEGTS
jgi:hypothetical protein